MQALIRFAAKILGLEGLLPAGRIPDLQMLLAADLCRILLERVDLNDAERLNFVANIIEATSSKNTAVTPGTSPLIFDRSSGRYVYRVIDRQAGEAFLELARRIKDICQGKAACKGNRLEQAAALIRQAGSCHA